MHLVLLSLLVAQNWAHYGGDAGGMKYSALKQVNRGNVTTLKPAWTYRSGDVSDGTAQPIRSAFETTPLFVDGVLYLTTPFNRLIALDAETGKELWAFDPKLDLGKPTNLYVNRGAAYWADGTAQQPGAPARRLFFGTLDGRLFSVDAATGKPDDSFGAGGHVDLRVGVADKYPGKGYSLTSPPAIYKNLVIVGSLVADGEPRGPAGDIRAFDAKTGKLAWTFHTVARPGEFGHDTWEGDGWKERVAANAWSMLSVDEKRGMVFLPLTSPGTDFYGGDRKGAGLFGDSVVALDAATGKRRWHFQTVHHNIWDYDLPAQPMLVTAKRGGTILDAVAQITKTGFVFLFDRVSGRPLFDIEERKVPPSEIPGEAAWPTQPHPVKPAPFARQSFAPADLADVSPEHRKFCQQLIEGATFGNLYTPIGLGKTVLFPGTNGGANWGGGSFDPETRTLYVNSMDVGMVYRLAPRPAGAEIPYRAQGFGTNSSRFWNDKMWPCQRPPWGHLTAINLDTGEFKWRTVLGVVDELMEKGLAPTGAPNIGGSLVTAGGLVFIGATNDSRFRAFDKESGKELWTVKLPASAHATPMTFAGRKSKKQFIVIAAGGGNKYNATYSDALVAYALP